LDIQNNHIHAQNPQWADGITLISQVASRINASLDLRETLNAIVCAAADLVPCTLAAIDLWDEPQQRLVLQALHSHLEQPFSIGQTFTPGEGYTGWVIRNKKPLLVPDVSARKDIQPRLLPGERPFKAYIGLPLLAGDELIGDLQLVHDQAEAFNEDDLHLLEALAGQAAIAIKNARIHGELNRHHQEHAALSSVTAAINRPLVLQDLLESALDSILTVTQADGGGIRLLDRQTDELTLAAYRGLSDSYVREASRFPISREIVGEVARTGQAILCDDMWDDPRVSPEVRLLLQDVGHRSLAQAPVVIREQVVGTLGITARTPGFFSQDDLRLLIAIGQQLGIAIERAQLYTDLAQRARELEVVNQVAAAVNQPGDLDQILQEGLEQALKLTELEMGAVGLRNPQDDSIILHSHYGMSPEFVEIHKSRLRQMSFTPWPEDLEVSILIEQIHPDSADTPVHLKEAGIRQTINVPLFAEGELVGALNLATRRTQPFTGEEQSLLLAIAYQLGTAIANTRLRQEALEAERLAVVGRVAAGVAHDLRSPLGGILRSAEFLARSEISPETRKKLSQAIVSLARRLISTSQGILDYIQGEKITLQYNPTNLTDFLDEVLDVLQIDFSDRGIEVVRDYRFRGEVVMDTDRFAQVVYNLAENARDAMPHGGKFIVTINAFPDEIELHFTDTGSGVPKELHERIFEPYFTYGKYKGAGLGLAIARQIVEEHGGSIRLESTGDQGSTFTVSLPA
jgi:GAF domain-containing protein/anti-sigma regulatory factor (Ser/Thr protein kinase)